MDLDTASQLVASLNAREPGTVARVQWNRVQDGKCGELAGQFDTRIGFNWSLTLCKDGTPMLNWTQPAILPGPLSRDGQEAGERRTRLSRVNFLRALDASVTFPVPVPVA